MLRTAGTIRALAGGLLLAACSRAAAPAEPRRVLVIDGLDQPESVQYDPRQDVYFVSSMAGFGSVRNGMGYIARVGAGGAETWEVFVQTGAGGARLDAPKGLALQGDTLWAADIDVLRGFDRRTGEPLAVVDLAPLGAVLLNAATVGPDGTLYVTDSGIVMGEKGVEYVGGDKIFAVAPDGGVRIVAEGPHLGHPNGITWDPAGERLLVVSFHPFGSELYALAPDGSRGEVLGTGPGRFDGVQVLPDGGVVVTAWSDSSLHRFAGGSSERVLRGLWTAADLGVDTRRNRIAIPLVLPGRVEVWELPGR